ncbi:hypothetical protein HJ051_12505 [Vibrio parahaemolyticus]|nr:hypothetical protein [Vibrio parahaemolyticus]
MKRFNLLAMLFFIFSFNVTFAENQTLEYKVSDCISVSDNRDLMTQIKANGECIDEISENNDLGDKNLATKKNSVRVNFEFNLSSGSSSIYNYSRNFRFLSVIQNDAKACL